MIRVRKLNEPSFSQRCYTERTELEFDSLSFLVHGSVRDILRYLSPHSSKLSLLLDKVCTVFLPCLGQQNN